MKGKLYVVGFGPGSIEDMTMRAADAIEDADIVTGYTAYVDIIKEFFPEKYYKSTGMMKEVDRCHMAVKDAASGKRVAMISSGDSGIYGMAGIIYQIADDMQVDIEIETIPGITAASSAASLLGAPLMHDTALISLSDLLTPFDLIMKRVECAGVGDMVTVFYNPRSKSRTDHLEEAVKVLSTFRSPETPVGIARNIGRRDENISITTLNNINYSEVDMFCTVIVGNSQTYISNNRMITPRGYKLRVE